MTDRPRIRIGTRKSPLALAQTGQVAKALITAAGGDLICELVPMSTTGDRLQDRRLIEAGGKGLFTKELDIALEEDRVDILVHSLKDVPVELPDDQKLMACPPREDPRDAFVSDKYQSFADLPEGAIMGTASLRRQAQTLAKRPDLNVTTLRGNVATRIGKIQSGLADATYLAASGLKRLDMLDVANGLMDIDQMLPAAGQGILALTAIPERLPVKVTEALHNLNDAATYAAAETERAFLKALDGSCRTPIAAHLSFISTHKISFKGEVLMPDGSKVWMHQSEHDIADIKDTDFKAIGLAGAKDIIDQAGGNLPKLEEA